VTATISAIYVTFGGQTSVIMTDLFQGVMLLATGLVLIVLGAQALGGLDEFWMHLPRSHRQAFPAFNADPSYPAVGIFWQDAMANSAMFYFLNQGILMRFMAARSVEEGRKAAVAVLAILMPIAAIVVASGGWVGRALAHAGILPADLSGDEVFFITSELLARPGVFGLIMASLTAALMSTVDSLITAVAAIVVNDVVRPLRPGLSEVDLLKAARVTSVAVSLIGIALVPVFAQFDSIYEAHGAFTAAVTPPMVVALLLGVFWRRYTPTAALATMVGGAIAIAASIVWPELVAPFAHGVPMKDPGDAFIPGAKQYKYMRALYGIAISAGLGVVVTLFTVPRPLEDVRGWVWGTASDALARYKGQPLGSAQEESASAFVLALPMPLGTDTRGLGDRPGVQLSASLAALIHASVGDVVYVTDTRAWLGGLNSGHGVVVEVSDGDGSQIGLPDRLWEIISEGRPDAAVSVQRLY
jgi:SSS family solute:Na+ symporter